MEFNIYCDESCHLEHNASNIMVFGAVWCPKTKRHEIFKRIREIKEENGLSPQFEMKWNKVSPGQRRFYHDVVDYFFDESDLHFRCLVVPDKTILNHSFFNQSHDDFYYKMYFDLLKVIFSPNDSFNIFIDIKDTRSQSKVNKLQTVLRNSQYDFHDQIIKIVQQVNSKEVELIQMTDLLTGAISYHHRNLNESPTKLSLIERIKARSSYSLNKSTLYKENKLNVFIWKARTLENGKF